MENQGEELPQESAVDVDIEKVVIKSFQDTLDAQFSVGAQTDFFESGGNSILGARLIALLRREVGVKVTIRDLFKSRNPRALALVIGERVSGKKSR